MHLLLFPFYLEVLFALHFCFEPKGFYHSVFFMPVTADIDDLNICYVLRNEENVTSDLFHFSVEDNGEMSIFFSYFSTELLPTLWLPLLCMSPKVLNTVAKWHFNKMLKDTNWLRWRSNLPLLWCGMVSVTFRLISSGESVTRLASLTYYSNNNSHLLAVMDSWAVKHRISAHSEFNSVYCSRQNSSSKNIFQISVVFIHDHWAEWKPPLSPPDDWCLGWLYSIHHLPIKWSDIQSNSAVVDQNLNFWQNLCGMTEAPYYFRQGVNVSPLSVGWFVSQIRQKLSEGFSV